MARLELQHLSKHFGPTVAVKDVIETADMPTEYGSDLFRGNRPIRDAASVYALRKGWVRIESKGSQAQEQ